PSREALNESANATFNPIETAQDFLRRRDGNIVFGKIYTRLKQRDKLDQLCLDRAYATGDRTFQLLRGDASLVKSSRIDEIPYGLGLRKIKATVQVGAQREFAWLRETRPRTNSGFYTGSKNNRSAMARDFNDVFARVGTRCGEIANNHLV